MKLDNFMHRVDINTYTPEQRIADREIVADCGARSMHDRKMLWSIFNDDVTCPKCSAQRRAVTDDTKDLFCYLLIINLALTAANIIALVVLQ